MVGGAGLGNVLGESLGTYLVTIVGSGGTGLGSVLGVSLETLLGEDVGAGVGTEVGGAGLGNVLGASLEKGLSVSVALPLVVSNINITECSQRNSTYLLLRVARHKPSEHNHTDPTHIGSQHLFGRFKYLSDPSIQLVF